MAGPYIQLKNAVLPEGSLVLVTGANGYIAANTCNQLLAAGYKVRGTVRNANKSAYLQELFDGRYGTGRFSLAHVEFMGQEGAFDDAMKGVDGVCHVASDTSLSPDAEKVIKSVVEGTMNCLRTAAREPSVKRFVYTSSSTAVYMADVNGTPARKVDQSVYNDACVEYVHGLIDPDNRVPHPNPGISDMMMIYAASKTQAEKQVWHFAKHSKTNICVNTVIPNVTFGEFVHPSHISSTGGMLLGLFNSRHPDDKGVKVPRMIPPKIYVDVEDVARLHVAALVGKDVKNQRLFAFSEPYNWNVVLDIFRKAYPDRQFTEEFQYNGSGRDETEFSEAKQKAIEAMESVGYENVFHASLADSIKATIAPWVGGKGSDVASNGGLKAKFWGADTV